MPKRNNPFGDHSSLQLKTHVGEKEVDKGVCQQTRMQAVYGKKETTFFTKAIIRLNECLQGKECMIDLAVNAMQVSVLPQTRGPKC